MVRINNVNYLKDTVFQRNNKYETRLTHENSKAYFKWILLKEYGIDIAFKVITASIYLFGTN